MATATCGARQRVKAPGLVVAVAVTATVVMATVLLQVVAIVTVASVVVLPTTAVTATVATDAVVATAEAGGDLLAQPVLASMCVEGIVVTALVAAAQAGWHRARIATTPAARRMVTSVTPDVVVAAAVGVDVGGVLMEVTAMTAAAPPLVVRHETVPTHLVTAAALHASKLQCQRQRLEAVRNTGLLGPPVVPCLRLRYARRHVVLVV